jgi:transcription elongation factor GreA
MIKRANYKKPDPVPFTQAGYDKLKVRQAELLAKREVVLVSLQRAREQGDLSENGAYTSAKFELGTVDRELRRLTHNIKYGVVMSAQGTSTVGFGNKITVSMNDKEYSYLLVGSEESDPAKAMLSIDSPVGKALLGKKVGDVVVVTMPDRTIEYVIKKISL